MKFHWGTGITIFIICCCSAFIFLVVQCFKEPHSLVANDYYEQELRFQEKIDKMKNAHQLSSSPELEYIGVQKKVRLSLPKEVQQVKGTIRFFRPSDKRMDFEIDLAMNDSNQQLIDATRMHKGLWKVMLDWQAEDGTAYFMEKSFVKP